jgi:hypothetical protein
MEKQLKEIIRSVVREQFISELSKNDVHVKEIMKFYDKGTYSTKKAVSIFVSGKPNATRNQILDDLGDMGYDDAWEVMDHFKLTLESVTEGDIVPDASVNEKSDDVFADYISSKGKTKGRSSRVDRVAKYGNYKFEFDDRDGTVRLLYNGKLISYGYPDWSTGGFIMIHSSWKNNDKPFNSLEDIIKYFKSKRITTEADVVPGGLAKGLSLNDIAEKHGVSVDMMVAEFKKGIAVEMEHTTDREVAKEITLDHLFEDPKYYDKLKKVEEYVDKKGVEHVAAALPQTEEEPVNEGSVLNEKQFKGLDGIPSNKSLDKISKDQKLKIIKAPGNIIDFIVPKGVSRNFWQVIGTGKVKKNSAGEHYLEGKVINSPMFKSLDDLIAGVKWDSMEQRRRFNESVTECKPCKSK